MSTEKDVQTETSVRIREAIDAKGLKIKEAAEQCGIPYRSFQNYTLGLREPNAEAFRLICTHLGVSLDWLLAGEGPMFRGETESAGDGHVAAHAPAQEPDLPELLSQLADSARREQAAAATQQERLTAIEKQLQELQAAVAALTRSP